MRSSKENPENRSVSFGEFMEKTKPTPDEDTDNPESKPWYNNRKLQIVSLIALVLLVMIGIGIIVASLKPKGT